MKLAFNTILAARYHSHLQQIRVMSEDWLCHHMYCVKCGKRSLFPCKNNTPGQDFYCQNCQEPFELKSTYHTPGTKIVDGAYDTMIEKIRKGTISNLFYLNYLKTTYEVQNLLIIPKHYFSKTLIEKRKPLSATARRSGWVGCNINIKKIPSSGKLFVIKNQQIENKQNIVKHFNQMLFLRNHTLEMRGWLLDILQCIENLHKSVFLLEEIYRFEPVLAQKYPANHNIRAKIRQQLQILRDNHYLVFMGTGMYKLANKDITL